MKALDKGFALAMALGSLLLAPSALAAVTADDSPVAVTADAWQGQGNGQRNGNGNGNGNARGTRNDGERTQAQRTRGRDEGSSSQGRGNARGQGNDDKDRGNQRNDDDRDRDRDNDDGRARGNSGPAHGRRHEHPSQADLRAHIDRMPESLRRYSTSTRSSERLILGALTLSSLRGTESGRYQIVSDGSRVRVANRNDIVLLDMSEDDVRRLGHWRMRRLGDHDARGRNGSPAFCVSGDGHPVHGREWCLEKGFGLGVQQRNIWSRATVDDVVFKRRPDTSVTLDRGGLIDVLGDVVLGRLAVQSLALGYQEPLVGRWVYSPQEPTAPWILKVNAGDVAIAEFVDTDRDSDVDVLFVTQPRW